MNTHSGDASALVILITALVTVIVAVLNGVQTIVLEMIKRKAAPIAREEQANLTVQKLAKSDSKFRAVSVEGMAHPVSDSGIFWKDRAERQEEVLAAVKRILVSSTYRDPAMAILAIRDQLASRAGAGDSSTHTTIPGHKR